MHCIYNAISMPIMTKPLSNLTEELGRLISLREVTAVAWRGQLGCVVSLCVKAKWVSMCDGRLLLDETEF